MKKYSKKKDKTLSDPNPAGPGFRTPRYFKVKSSMFSKENMVSKQSSKVKFNPSTFKVQHKG